MRLIFLMQMKIYHKLIGKYFDVSKINNLSYKNRKFMILYRKTPCILCFDYDNKTQMNFFGMSIFFTYSFKTLSTLEPESFKIYYDNIDECKNDYDLIKRKIKFYEKNMDKCISEIENKIK
jgi:hypothetical protein